MLFKYSGIQNIFQIAIYLFASWYVDINVVLFILPVN